MKVLLVFHKKISYDIILNILIINNKKLGHHRLNN